MLLESVLQKMISQNVPVRIFVTNGAQMRGTIVRADESSLIINSDGTDKMVRVAAISTVEPMGAFKI